MYTQTEEQEERRRVRSPRLNSHQRGLCVYKSKLQWFGGSVMPRPAVPAVLAPFPQHSGHPTLWPSDAVQSPPYQGLAPPLGGTSAQRPPCPPQPPDKQHRGAHVGGSRFPVAADVSDERSSTLYGQQCTLWIAVHSVAMPPVEYIKQVRGSDRALLTIPHWYAYAREACDDACSCSAAARQYSAAFA